MESTLTVGFHPTDVHSNFDEIWDHYHGHRGMPVGIDKWARTIDVWLS